MFTVVIGTLFWYAAWAVLYLTNGRTEMSADAYAYIRHFAAPWAWGLWSLITAGTIFIGLHLSNWRFARFGIALGLFSVALRWIFFAQAALDGIPGGMTGVITYGLQIVVFQYALMKEPPSNPDAQKPD